MTDKKKVIKALAEVIGVVLVLVLIGSLFVGSLKTNTDNNSLITTHVQQIFVDVNKDGLDDLLVSGEVVFQPDAAPLGLTQVAPAP